MILRSVMPWDLTNALAHARSCRGQENDRWRVAEPTPDGEELCAAIELQESVIVVTVFWPEEE
jgi:hypothetical protein